MGKEATKRSLKKGLYDGFSMLHLAAMTDAVCVVEALVVEHGMDMNLKNGRAYTPLDIKAWIEKCKSKGQPIISPKSGIEMGETLLFNQTHKTSVLEFIEKKRKRWEKICEAREKEEVDKGGEGGGRGDEVCVSIP